MLGLLFIIVTIFFKPFLAATFFPRQTILIVLLKAKILTCFVTWNSTSSCAFLPVDVSLGMLLQILQSLCSQLHLSVASYYCLWKHLVSYIYRACQSINLKISQHEILWDYCLDMYTVQVCPVLVRLANARVAIYIDRTNTTPPRPI